MEASSRPINIASVIDSVVLTEWCSHCTLVCRAGMKREAEEAMRCPRTTKRFYPFQKMSTVTERMEKTPRKVKVFARSVTQPGRLEAGLAAITPCRLQLSTV